MYKRRAGRRNEGNENFEMYYEVITGHLVNVVSAERRLRGMWVGTREQEILRSKLVDFWLHCNRRRVYQWLKKNLDSGGSLVDLFSGDASVPVALLMDGKISDLTLVDSPASSYNRYVRRALEQFGLGDRVVQEILRITDQTECDSLPSGAQVSMIGSGLIFPRAERGDDPVPDPRGHMLKVSHIDKDSPVELEDVLCGLSGEKRTLWFADNTWAISPGDLACARSHIESVVDRFGGEWKVGDLRRFYKGKFVAGSLKHL